MFKRNTHDDSSVAVAAVKTNRVPMDTSMDFESVAMSYSNDLYRTALHICSKPAKASAVVQETYLRAWIAFGKYPPRTNCKRWLFQILFNVVRLERQTSLPCVEDHPGNSVLPALSRVPAEAREVLLLVDCQGFSYKEAGEILGLSSGLVERRVVLGRNQLHSELEACCAALVAAAH